MDRDKLALIGAAISKLPGTTVNSTIDNLSFNVTNIVEDNILVEFEATPNNKIYIFITSDLNDTNFTMQYLYQLMNICSAITFHTFVVKINA